MPTNNCAVLLGNCVKKNMANKEEDNSMTSITQNQENTHVANSEMQDGSPNVTAGVKIEEKTQSRGSIGDEANKEEDNSMTSITQHQENTHVANSEMRGGSPNVTAGVKIEEKAKMRGSIGDEENKEEDNSITNRTQYLENTHAADLGMGEGSPNVTAEIEIEEKAKKERLNIQHIIEQNKIKSDEIILLYEYYDKSIDMLKEIPFSTQLDDELHFKEKKMYIKRQIKKLEEIDLPIVVAGEVKAGKSTFLNLLIGEKLLPTSVLECTSVICVIHNNNSKGFVVKNMETGKTIHEKRNVDKRTNSKDFQEMLKEYAILQKGKKTENLIIDIYWPIPFLKKNTVLVDTPGTSDNPEIISRVKAYLTNALVFVFVINTPNAGGFQADRVKAFFELSNPYDTPFDPRTAIFICNKWQDVRNAHEEEAVLEYIKSKLKQWPSFNPEKDLFILDAKEEMRQKENNLDFTDNFKNVLAKIDEIIAGCLDMKIMLHINGLNYHLRQFYTHVNARVCTSYMSPEKKRQKIKQLEQSIGKLESKQEEIITKYKDEAHTLWRDLSEKLYEDLTKNETKEYLTHWNGFYFAETWTRLELTHWAETYTLQKFQRLQTEWRENFMEARVKKLVDKFKNETNYIYEIKTEFDSILDCSLDCSFNKSEQFPVLLKAFVAMFLPILSPFSWILHDIFHFSKKNKNKAENYSINKEKLMSDHALCVLNRVSREYTADITKNYFLDPFCNLLENFSKHVKQITKSRRILIKNIKHDSRSYSNIVQLFTPVKDSLEEMIGGLIFIKIKFGYSKLAKKQTSLDYSTKESLHSEDTNAFIYKGTFANEQNHNVAVKILETPLKPSNYFEQLVEIEKLGQIEHDNIVILFGVSLTEKNGLDHLQLIIELCEMSLEEMIFKEKLLSVCADVSSDADLQKSQEFTTFRAYCQDILKGLIFIHKSNIVHKNLKLSNIMIIDEVAKITDFWTYTKDINGTPTHVAPELFTDHMYGPETDVYSLGILLWEFWFGRKVSDACNLNSVESVDACNLNSVESVTSFFKDQNRRPLTELPRKISPLPWLKEIIVACWDSEQSKRPNLESVLKSFENPSE